MNDDSSASFPPRALVSTFRNAGVMNNRALTLPSIESTPTPSITGPKSSGNARFQRLRRVDVVVDSTDVLSPLRRGCPLLLLVRSSARRFGASVAATSRCRRCARGLGRGGLLERRRQQQQCEPVRLWRPESSAVKPSGKTQPVFLLLVPLAPLLAARPRLAGLLRCAGCQARRGQKGHQAGVPVRLLPFED